MAAQLTLRAPTDLPVAVPAERPDAELMRRIVRGDAAAFEALYLELYQRLFRFIYRMVPSPESAEDLVNETMLVVWENPEGFDYSCKVSTWVFGIAYRKALKASAKNARTAGTLSVDELADRLPDRKPCETRRMEADDWLEKALATLSPEHRAVVELTYHLGLPYQEIAEILGCPENTVKTRMFHARRKLQPLLGELRPGLENHASEEMP